MLSILKHLFMWRPEFHKYHKIFHKISLEVVDRGSETQLQVAENLN